MRWKSGNGGRGKGNQMRFGAIGNMTGVKDWWVRFRAKPNRTALDRLALLLQQEKAPYGFFLHPKACTAPALASAIRIPGREVAKVVVVRSARRYFMAVLPADLQIDMVRLARLIGVDAVSLAKERELKRLFPDCEVGAMPPLGILYDIPVYIDAHLAEEEVIFFPAGSHHEVIEMRYDDFERLVRPAVGGFAASPSERAVGFYSWNAA
jgi:Ala-tRNA(Pro) deacylase